ncbi:hypothetical protein DL546_009255 [Coniochaeta pulveracea]|uniref:Uncharacterized protein n=1 Tax=Coniochaeta pulveracea TaxID=177199 RepID=A0A420YHV1_9PEZI|nr:hypothetical protein DL546_009255 [Coniochaeta pulveracea]
MWEKPLSEVGVHAVGYRCVVSSMHDIVALSSFQPCLPVRRWETIRECDQGGLIAFEAACLLGLAHALLLWYKVCDGSITFRSHLAAWWTSDGGVLITNSV